MLKHLLYAGVGLASLLTATNAGATIIVRAFDNGVPIFSATDAATPGDAAGAGSSAHFQSVRASASGFPTLDIPNFSTNTIDASKRSFGGTATLRIEATQTNLTTFAGLGSFASTFTENFLTAFGVGSVSISNYYDAGNTAFGTSTLLATVTQANNSTSNSQGPIVKAITFTGAPFSETVIYAISFTSNTSPASVSASSQIIGTIPIPEPMSLALLGSGLLGLGLIRRTSRR